MNHPDSYEVHQLDYFEKGEELLDCLNPDKGSGITQKNLELCRESKSNKLSEVTKNPRKINNKQIITKVKNLQITTQCFL